MRTRRLPVLNRYIDNEGSVLKVASAATDVNVLAVSLGATGLEEFFEELFRPVEFPIKEYRVGVELPEIRE